MAGAHRGGSTRCPPTAEIASRIAKKTEVPILQHEGRYVQGSGAILDYIADRLGGSKLTPASAEARAHSLELEQEMDRAFGRGVQRVVYSEMLKPAHRQAMIELWADNGPRWARRFYSFAFPVIATAVKRMYKTTHPELVEKAQDQFLATMDELDARLARTPYLGGGQPSRLDITAAAFLIVIVFAAFTKRFPTGWVVAAGIGLIAFWTLLRLTGLAVEWRAVARGTEVLKATRALKRIDDEEEVIRCAKASVWSTVGPF